MNFISDNSAPLPQQAAPSLPIPPNPLADHTPPVAQPEKAAEEAPTANARSKLWVLLLILLLAIGWFFVVTRSIGLDIPLFQYSDKLKKARLERAEWTSSCCRDLFCCRTLPECTHMGHSCTNEWLLPAAPTASLEMNAAQLQVLEELSAYDIAGVMHMSPEDVAAPMGLSQSDLVRLRRMARDGLMFVGDSTVKRMYVRTVVHLFGITDQTVAEALQNSASLLPDGAKDKLIGLGLTDAAGGTIVHYRATQYNVLYQAVEQVTDTGWFDRLRASGVKHVYYEAPFMYSLDSPNSATHSAICEPRVDLHASLRVVLAALLQAAALHNITIQVGTANTYSPFEDQNSKAAFEHSESTVQAACERCWHKARCEQFSQTSQMMAAANSLLEEAVEQSFKTQTVVHKAWVDGSGWVETEPQLHLVWMDRITEKQPKEQYIGSGRYKGPVLDQMLELMLAPAAATAAPTTPSTATPTAASTTLVAPTCHDKCLDVLISEGSTSRQVNSYIQGKALAITIHITHHAGTALCAVMKRVGPAPAFACMVPGKDSGGYQPPVKTWSHSDTAANIQKVRPHYHFISWEYKSYPGKTSLHDTNWEHQDLVSMIVVRDPIERFLAGGKCGPFHNLISGDPTPSTQGVYWDYANSGCADNYALKVLANKSDCANGASTSMACLESAKNLLKRFNFILDQACLDKSVDAMLQVLHINTTMEGAVGTKNAEGENQATHAVGVRARINNDTLFDFLRHRFRRDIQLYEWSKTQSIVQCESQV